MKKNNRKASIAILIPKGTHLWNPVTLTTRQQEKEIIAVGQKVYEGKKTPTDYHVIIGPYTYTVAIESVKVVPDMEMKPGEVKSAA